MIEQIVKGSKMYDLSVWQAFTISWNITGIHLKLEEPLLSPLDWESRTKKTSPQRQWWVTYWAAPSLDLAQARAVRPPTLSRLRGAWSTWEEPGRRRLQITPKVPHPIHPKKKKTRSLIAQKWQLFCEEQTHWGSLESSFCAKVFKWREGGARVTRRWRHACSPSSELLLSKSNNLGKLVFLVALPGPWACCGRWSKT